ncbi:hypothetical protein J3459_011361 [Metarhizium acridum]|nr:hypothetical protein J3459_011361 [Metarhizium acridum]
MVAKKDARYGWNRLTEECVKQVTSEHSDVPSGNRESHWWTVNFSPSPSNDVIQGGRVVFGANWLLTAHWPEDQQLVFVFRCKAEAGRPSVHPRFMDVAAEKAGMSISYWRLHSHTPFSPVAGKAKAKG